MSFFFLLLLILSIYGRRSRVSRLRVPLEPQEPAKTSESIVQRKLLSESTTLYARDIVMNYNQIYEMTYVKNFPNDLIGFVTPWNKEGLNISKEFRHKFGMIVPVWYDVRLSSTIDIERSEEFDKGYLKQLKKSQGIGFKTPKICPRFYFSQWSKQDLYRFLNNDKLVSQFIGMIKKECQEVSYDGVFLDFGSLTTASVPATKEAQQEFSFFLIKMNSIFEVVGKALHTDDLLFYVSVAPPNVFGQSMPILHPLIIQRAITGQFLDGFVVMTYDYGGKSGGPNAPLQWALGSCQSYQQVMENADRIGLGEIRSPPPSSIYLGINFYGTDTVGGSLVRNLKASDYIDVLSRFKTTFSWNVQAYEHLVEYYDDEGKKDHQIYYPTLLSIYHRILQAREQGYGIAIWELGQGLDYFLDLF